MTSFVGVYLKIILVFVLVSFVGCLCFTVAAAPRPKGNLLQIICFVDMLFAKVPQSGCGRKVREVLVAQ